METSPHIQRLWDLSQQRADEIGKQLTDVAADAEVSAQSLYKWRKGGRVTGITDRKISRALLWEPGSRQAILDGADPTPIAEGVPHPEHAPPAQGRYTREQAERIIDAALEGLPLEEQLKVLQRFNEDLRAQQREQSGGGQRSRRAG